MVFTSLNTEKEAETDIVTPSNLSYQTASEDGNPNFDSHLGSQTEDGDIEACAHIVTHDQETSGNLKEKIVERIRTISSWKDPGPPPDGGRVAWIQVAMGHLVIFNTWGFINSFGVFQTYYTTTLNLSPSSISWIGSIQVFLTFILGTVAGRLSDAGHFRLIIFLGTLLLVLGTFLTSICTTYPTLFLTQGVLTGIGFGLVFCPTTAIVSTYFKDRRGIALAFVTCGSATGGLVFPAMVQQLLPKLGFAWTMRVVGFLQLGLMGIANLGLRPRLPPRRAGPWVEWGAFKEGQYSLYAAGMFFSFWGVYFAFYYISSYARSILGLSYTESIDLLLTLSGVGILARIFTNLLGDKFAGPFNLLIPACFISSILIYSWTAVSSTTDLYIWACLYGFFGAAIQGLFPYALSSLTTDLRKAGTRMGMIFSIVGFAVLTGPPIAGALISADGGSYLGAQLFAGTSLLLGCAFLTACRWVKSGGVLLVKV